MVAPFSKFYGKILNGFCLSTGKRFFLTVKAWILLKNGTWDFRNSFPFERSTCFYVTISGNFDRIQYFNFETDRAKIEITSLPYKIVMSEATVKTNRMVLWTKMDLSKRTEFCQ